MNMTTPIALPETEMRPARRLDGVSPHRQLPCHNLSWSRPHPALSLRRPLDDHRGAAGFVAGVEDDVHLEGHAHPGLRRGDGGQVAQGP